MCDMEGKELFIYTSGKQYRLKGNILENIPQTILEKASINDDKIMELFLNRHADSFESILWYFSNGELHMPISVCPAVFEKELDFWQIDASVLSKCCYLRFIAFFEDQELLKSFTKTKIVEENEKTLNGGYGKWRDIQSKGWRLLDDASSSLPAKMYASISAIVILISVFVVCASTHPNFQRDLYLQEWLEYYSDEPKKFSLLQLLKEKEDGDQIIALLNSTEKYFLNKPIPRPYPNVSSISIANMYNLSVTANAFNNAVRNNTMFESRVSKTRPALPSTATRYKYLEYIDIGTVVYFGLELVIRFLFCPYKSKFFFGILNIVDIVALLSEVVIFILERAYPKEKFDDFSPLDIVECIQILRVFRIFRILKRSINFKILMFSLKASIYNMLMMTFLLSIAVLVFACVGYYSDREVLISIPDAMWWAVVTMTTVGYGDMYPKSQIGKLVGTLCAISGVFVLALLIPVLVNNFILFISFSKIHGKQKTTANKVRRKRDDESVIPLMTSRDV